LPGASEGGTEINSELPCENDLPPNWFHGTEASARSTKRPRLPDCGPGKTRAFMSTGKSVWLDFVEVHQSGNFQLDRITFPSRRTIEDAMGNFMFCIRRPLRNRQTIDRPLHNNAKHHQLFGLVDMTEFYCRRLRRGSNSDSLGCGRSSKFLSMQSDASPVSLPPIGPHQARLSAFLEQRAVNLFRLDAPHADRCAKPRAIIPNRWCFELFRQRGIAGPQGFRRRIENRSARSTLSAAHRLVRQ